MVHAVFHLLRDYRSPFGGIGNKEHLIPKVLLPCFLMLGKFPNGFKSRALGTSTDVGWHLLYCLCDHDSLEDLWTIQKDSVGGRVDYVWELMVWVESGRDLGGVPGGIGTHYESQQFVAVFRPHIKRMWAWLDDRRRARGLPVGPVRPQVLIRANYRRHPPDGVTEEDWEFIGGGKIHHW